MIRLQRELAFPGQVKRKPGIIQELGKAFSGGTALLTPDAPMTASWVICPAYHSVGRAPCSVQARCLEGPGLQAELLTIARNSWTTCSNHDIQSGPPASQCSSVVECGPMGQRSWLNSQPVHIPRLGA